MSDLSPAKAVAAFDSASAMVRATSRALQGQSFPRLGQSRLRALPVRLSAALPANARRAAYTWIGAAEGIPADRLGDVDMDAIAAWVVGQYPRRQYSGVLVGSSNGAAVHLCAATGMAWLPQTLLVPVRWAGNDPDDPRRALDFGQRVARPLLERNPDIVLHHMHDGNQDRLMVGRMTYFRLKWTKLPPAYHAFLRDSLAPEAPVVILDDTSTWPTTTVAERHVFQTGARGGIDAEEYLWGSPRVAEFLRTHGSARSRFNAPEPDGRSPEAEWGFEAALGDDIRSSAAEQRRAVLRLTIPSPQALAAPVADLLRGQIREAGGHGDHLIVESFVMLDAVEAQRSNSVPYWTFFGVEPARRAALEYVSRAAGADDPYADVDVMLFPHGVDSAGATRPSTWLSLAEHITGHVTVPPGVQQRWPAHFDHLATYTRTLRRCSATHNVSNSTRLDPTSALGTLTAHGIQVE